MTLNPLARPFVPERHAIHLPIKNNNTDPAKNLNLDNYIENKILELSKWATDLGNDENDNTEPKWLTNPTVENSEEQKQIEENIKRLAQWINEFPNNKQTNSPEITTKSFPISKLKNQLLTPVKREDNSLIREIEQMKKHCANQHTTISDLKAAIRYQSFLLTKPLELESTEQNPIIWRINNFAMALSEAKQFPTYRAATYCNQCGHSLHSPIFDTELATYKISFQLVPYGVGIFRGTHASLKCKLWSLEPPQKTSIWPFNHPLQVIVIDLSNYNNRWVQTIPRSTPGQNSRTQKASSTSDDLNFDDFIPLTKLLSFSERFLLQNTLTLEIKLNL